ncbi:L domain-like protein [Anaeromyces robustus]|uniref:L domain-like protein n=1 Tax=Anaeromyces robustus TaxID=1754192 RepID=A0A1Y1X1Q9_9FUNG|nr:L domain-like protein [Anaeromyces robustus]|eukprot:ORX79558.1 L domain-like protein [Anaeromyces robustus]
MGNKISKSDGNITIGVVNTSFPDKKHIDITQNSNNNNDNENDNQVRSQITQINDTVSLVSTNSTLSRKKKADNLIYNDDENRVTLKVEDLSDYININLCSKKLVEISPIALFSTSLIYLTLCCNYLKEIPESIGLLTNLKVLDVSNNLLTSIPSSIGLLKKLENLLLAYNKISYLPIELKNLRKLKILNLRNNDIIELPQELKELKSLVTLDVSSNQLVSIPAEICNIKTLQKIYINNCPLIYSSCVPSLVKEIPSLKELASRVIIRHNIPINDNLSDELKYYLGSAHQCSFCHGPFFETYEKRNQLIRRNDVNIPLEYKLCISHWNSEEERIKVLFSKLPYTSPSPIKQSNNNNNSSNLYFNSSNIKGLKSKSTVGNDYKKIKNKLSKSRSYNLLSKSESKLKFNSSNSSTNTLGSLISSPSIDNYYQVDYKTNELTFSNELLNLGSSTSSLHGHLKSSSSYSLLNPKSKQESSFLSLFLLKKT